MKWVVRKPTHCSHITVLLVNMFALVWMKQTAQTKKPRWTRNASLYLNLILKNFLQVSWKLIPRPPKSINQGLLIRSRRVVGSQINKWKGGDVYVANKSIFPWFHSRYLKMLLKYLQLLDESYWVVINKLLVLVLANY